MLIKNVEISIRTMKSRELGQIVTIVNKEIYKGASGSELLAWLKSIGSTSGNNIYTPWYVATSQVGDEILGFVRYVAFDFDFEKRRVMIELSLLAIKKEYQGIGVGSKLVEDSLKKLYKRWQGKGVEPVMVMVAADEQNHVARKLYEKIFEKADSILIENVWGPDKGTIFYFKRLT